MVSYTLLELVMRCRIQNLAKIGWILAELGPVKYCASLWWWGGVGWGNTRPILVSIQPDWAWLGLGWAVTIPTVLF